MAFFLKSPSFWDAEKVPFYILFFIGPLSLLYRAVFWLRHKLYNNHLKSSIPVICVGNVTMGGTGKTPTAIALYSLIHKKHPEICIHFVTRGYGGKRQGPLMVDLKKSTFLEVGDEALLLAQHAPTWVARNRLKGVQAAAKEGANLVILDDGLQNASVPKDFSLIVFDGKKGLGNGHIFPLGPLRESFASASKKADFFVVVGSGEKPLLQRLKTIRKGIVETFLEPLKVDKSKLKGKAIFAFAGIGYPEKFFCTLQKMGLSLISQKAFPDHYPYTEREIQSLVREAEERGAFCVTTEKDKVRIPLKYHKDIEAVSVELKGLERNKEFCISLENFLKEKNLIKEN